MQDNDVHFPTTTSPWWICWPILNVNAGISMMSYVNRRYANTSCYWCFFPPQILAVKSTCLIASHRPWRIERDVLTYLIKRCSSFMNRHNTPLLGIQVMKLTVKSHNSDLKRELRVPDLGCDRIFHQRNECNEYVHLIDMLIILIIKWRSLIRIARKSML